MTEKIFENKLRSLFSAPVIVLCLFVFFTNILNVLYFAYDFQPSAIFELLSALGFWMILCWWLMEDSKKYGFQWFLDIGFFIYIAWIILIPYYLFKTRGLRALITILLFIGILVSGYLLSLIVYFLLT